MNELKHSQYMELVTNVAIAWSVHHTAPIIIFIDQRLDSPDLSPARNFCQLPGINFSVSFRSPIRFLQFGFYSCFVTPPPTDINRFAPFVCYFYYNSIYAHNNHRYRYYRRRRCTHRRFITASPSTATYRQY